MPTEMLTTNISGAYSRTLVEMSDPKNAGGTGKRRDPAWGYQALFDHMYEEHGLTLLESEMQEIVRIVEGMKADVPHQARRDSGVALDAIVGNSGGEE